MADETKEEIIETKDAEVKDPEVKDTETKEVELDSSGKPVDDGPGFVKKMMGKLGIGVDKKEDVITEPVKEDTLDGKDIPDEFVKTVKVAGWSDKDIVDFASNYSDDELKEMIPFLLEEDKQELEEKPPVKQEETPKPLPDLSKEELIKAIKEEVRKEFQGEIDSLKEKVSVVDSAHEAHEQQVMLDTVNNIFDVAGKEFEVFGNTKDLPTFPVGPKKGQYIPTAPSVKARQEVWAKAYAFIQSGSNVQEAMQDALTWYKGKNLVTDVKRNFIKDLKKTENKLSAKRTSKETVPSFEDEDEYRADFIRKEAEKLGLKFEE